MNTTTTIGLDPGKTGFVGILRDGVPSLVPMPQDLPTLLAMITQHSPAAIAVEKVGPSPRQASRAAFSFGKSAMLVESAGLLYASLRPCQLFIVQPTKWKSRFRLVRPDRVEGTTYKQNKQEAARLARELWPALQGITNDSADAILLAEFAYREAQRSLAGSA